MLNSWVNVTASIGRDDVNLLVELRHQTGLLLKYWPDKKLIQLWKPYPTAPWEEAIVTRMKSGDPFPLAQDGHFNEVPSLEAAMLWIHECFWHNKALSETYEN